MKSAIILYTCLFMGTVLQANTIDHINNVRELNKFLNKIEPDALHNEVENIKFYKYDLDGDGQKDLIIDSDDGLKIIVGSRNNKYDISYLNRNYHLKYYLKNIVVSPHLPTMIILVDSELLRSTHYYNYTSKYLDTLIYRYDGLVNYVNSPAKHTIGKISLSSGACFGACPVFRIEIDSIGNITYLGVQFNNLDGTYVGRLSQKTFQELIQLINYSDFTNLEDHYAVNWTDDATTTLQISYDNGKKKTIQDYGECGTLTLKTIYKTLFDFRKNQKLTCWDKLNDKDLSHLLSNPVSFYFRYPCSESLFFKHTRNKKVRKFIGIVDITFHDNDSTFYLTDKYFGGCNALSIGKWSMLNDSTVILNWDAAKTFKLIREKPYLGGKTKFDKITPARIENWKLVLKDTILKAAPCHYY